MFALLVDTSLSCNSLLLGFEAELRQVKLPLDFIQVSLAEDSQKSNSDSAAVRLYQGGRKEPYVRFLSPTASILAVWGGGGHNDPWGGIFQARDMQVPNSEHVSMVYPEGAILKLLQQLPSPVLFCLDEVCPVQDEPHQLHVRPQLHAQHSHCQNPAYKPFLILGAVCPLSLTKDVLQLLLANIVLFILMTTREFPSSTRLLKCGCLTMQAHLIYVIDRDNQQDARVFMKRVLTCGGCNAFFAISGSSMALSWKQLSLTPVNGVDLLVTTLPYTFQVCASCLQFLLLRCFADLSP